MHLQDHFGSLVFNKQRMKKKLPYPIYLCWKNAIRKENFLDADTADIIAHAMKEWAIENGATHYSHWFFPLHGQTAKKHESFLNRSEDGEAIVRFSGKELIKGEPDASSFPSGGLRATFEARGYTYWDPSSYAFILDHVLYIPSIFVSYSGETLDMKGPLLRAHDLCSTNATRVLNALSETHTWRVRSMVGIEQEFFLIDEAVYFKRRDLVLCGKTVIGALPSKGQNLDDHYLGAIPDRVLKYLDEINDRLWSLGVFVKTAHNEVAPCQFEIVPLHEHCNVAVDDNHMIMEILRKSAENHGLVCLLHEKPFQGVNGSGKHNNWSLVSNYGENCFDPGEDPSRNPRFLLFVTAVIEAVDRYQDLFRYSASNPGNDYRLGGDEAPPSIISITMGRYIESVLKGIVNPEAEALRCDKQMRINYLESVPYDDSDRNRTSPFAFTGNKFEFRMPGSSKAAAEANIALNAAVGHVLGEYADRLEEADKEQRSTVVDNILVTALTKHMRIIFDGDGYGDKWKEEAKRRGLSDVKTHLEALRALLDENVQSLFTSHDIYTHKELAALYEVCVEEFVHIRTIEMKVLIAIVHKDVVLAVIRELKELGEMLSVVSNAAVSRRLQMISDELDRLITAQNELERFVEFIENTSSTKQQAKRINEEGVLLVKAVRNACDALEPMISQENWTLPTYDDIFSSL